MSVHINILLICMFICMCCVYLCIKSSEIELQLFLMVAHTHSHTTHSTQLKDMCCKAPSVFHLIRYSSLFFFQFSIVELFGFGDSFFSWGQSLFSILKLVPVVVTFLSVYSIYSTTTSDSVWTYVSVHINILLICMFICMCCVYLCIKSSEIEF